ncbi:MAG: 30S ribosomal protein S24e [archaeon]|nr:30S ribosomal protein S24e [archaeon]
MSLKIDIIEKKNNPLTKRNEITFKIDIKKGGTPNRLDVKNKIAAMETADESLVFVKAINSTFGKRSVTGRVDIYEDAENAKKYEPSFMKIRNLPKEERDPARKQLRELRKKKKVVG